MALVAVAGCVLHLAAHDPGEAGSAYPACPTRAALGLLCPGCGSLTALHALLHGRLAAAWEANALAVVGLPLMALGVAAVARTAWTGGPLRVRRIPGLSPVVVALGLVAWTIGRNL